MSPEFALELDRLERLANSTAQYDLLVAALHRGVELGIRRYAHWKDGTQYVGTCGNSLQKAMSELDKDFGMKCGHPTVHDEDGVNYCQRCGTYVPDLKG